MLDDYYISFTRSRVTRTGGSTGTASAATESYIGFIQPVSGREVFQSGKAGERVTHRLYTPITSDVIYRDKITQNGKDYIAVFTNQITGISGISHHKEILLESLS